MAKENSNKKMRIFKRINHEFEIRYKPLNSQNWYLTVTKGIGTGGVCLISMEYLGIGTILNLQIPLPNSKSLIYILGEVLWCDFLTDKNLYESGIKFNKINSNVRILISEYIVYKRQSGK